MGRGAARLLVLGATVLVAALLAEPALASSPQHTRTIDGGVHADGTPAAVPPDWVVVHPSPGVYRLVTSLPAVDLDVPRWDAVADVTIVPMGEGDTEIRFAEHGVPVDTGFSFTAVER